MSSRKNMDKNEMEEKIKQMKENKYCALCTNEKLFDGCSVQMVAITESGKIEEPSIPGMSSMLPLCGYHMVIAQEGFIAMTIQNQIISPRMLSDMEQESDEEIKKIIKNLGRSNKDQFNKSMMHTAKTVLNARKFQEDMKKRIDTQGEKSQGDNTNERRK